MFRFPTGWLAFALVSGAAALHPGHRLEALQANDPGTAGSQTRKATLKPAALKPPDIPLSHDEVQIERHMLVLANESRQRTGAAPLTLDEGLTTAARLHAQAMVAAGHLSHQFDGERSLQQRIFDSTTLHVDQVAENVALDDDAEHGHEHFMLSPAHRANLLNPAYNVAGLGVVRSGSELYIVEVFGHAVASYAPEELKDRIAASLNQARRQAGQPNLKRNDLNSATAEAAACSMAQANSLETPEARNFSAGTTAFRYTGSHPETLPRGAEGAIADRNLQRVAIGTCYARTVTHPTGAYWVVVAMQ